MVDHLQSRHGAVREPCEGSGHYIENGCTSFNYHVLSEGVALFDPCARDEDANRNIP